MSKRTNIAITGLAVVKFKKVFYGVPDDEVASILDMSSADVNANIDESDIWEITEILEHEIKEKS